MGLLALRSIEAAGSCVSDDNANEEMMSSSRARVCMVLKLVSFIAVRAIELAALDRSSAVHQISSRHGVLSSLNGDLSMLRIPICCRVWY